MARRPTRAGRGQARRTPFGRTQAERETELPPGAQLGEDLRRLRRSRGLTLAELALKVGRSVGYLSQVERGLSDVGIDDLRSLAAALDAPLSWFLVHDEIEGAERGRVVRWGRRRAIGSIESGHREELLSPDLGGSFEVILSVFAPGAERPYFLQRDTEETGYLMSGELELWIGEERFHLFAGDSFRLEGELMRWRNPGEEACEVVWVIAPPIY